MEHINDDMDELFRRAAEGYPLNTDSADWNAVDKKLASERSAKGENTSANNKNYKHLLWVLLLLPMAWVYYNYISDDNKKPGSASSKNITDKTLPDASKKINPVFNASEPLAISINNSSGVISSAGIHQKEKEEVNAFILKNNNPYTPYKASYVITNSISELPGKKEGERISEVSNKKETAAVKDEMLVSKNEVKSDSFKSYNGQILNNPQKNIRKRQEHGLYAGIVISPDISTVRFQLVKDIGVGMGVIVGYRLNNKFSIESGISWDKKSYYTDGKYFSTKRVYTNTTAKIKNADGVCYMIEVPLILKYYIKSSGKTNFSASAGLATYIMKKEKYDYLVENNGQQYQRSATYNNSLNNILGIANFSVGYNKALRQNLELRIEPYIKIPLNGVGIGSLPIMSTGVNIAAIKKLSR